MRSALAVCVGWFGTGGGHAADGVGTRGTPSLKAMIRVTFRNFKAGRCLEEFPTVMAAPP